MTIRLLLGAAVLITSQVGAFAKTYTNSTFGLQVELPPGRVICPAERGESDRGFIILWETNKCPPGDDVAGIYVNVEYNATERRSTLELGKDNCGGWTVRPSPFTVAGLRFYQCRSITDRGRISRVYFVLRNEMLSSPDNEVSYGVTLVCPRDDCRKLMPMTRRIFAHMKFVRQE